MTSAVTFPITRPPLSLLSSEPLRAAWEFLSHKLATRQPPLTRGDGHPIVFFPGLGSDGRALAPLRQYCQTMGYQAIDWGRGFNAGPKGAIDPWLGELAEHTRNLIRPHAQPATLIGWSLGGFYARETAKILKGQGIRQVITLGTPFNDGVGYTNVAWVFRLLNGSELKIDPALAARLRKPPPVPTTSIYSRSDGVVAWQTCRHANRHRQVRDIEVEGSHCGMGWNPRIIKVITELLAEPAGARRARE